MGLNFRKVKKLFKRDKNHEDLTDKNINKVDDGSTIGTVSVY